MATAQFTRFEPLTWKSTERTPIKVITSDCKAYCYHCHETVTPNVIVTPYLSMPLDVCPRCAQKIQRR